MATKYEYYLPTATTDFRHTWGVNWNAQTFTPQVNHIITSVKLQLCKAGTPTGTFTVSIRATDGDGKPTGADLCSGTTDYTTLAVYTSSELREIIFSSGALLLAGSVYAIVLGLSSGDGGNNVGWNRVIPTGSYANGSPTASSNSGVTWGSLGTFDFLFQDWGDPGGSGGGGAIFPSDAQTRVTSLIHRYDRGTCTLEINLGEVTADFGLPEWDSRPRPATPIEEPAPGTWEDLMGPDYPSPPIVVPTPKPAPPTPPYPEGVTPIAKVTERTKVIMETEAYKAAEARRKGLEQGLEAVATPYAIDVLRRKEKEASLLAEIRRLQAAASVTGGALTPYARNVLIKRAIELKRQLKALYESG